KAITEMDSVRAHVEDADYWEDHDQDDRTSK
ncbi:MAG: hypothetical protein ACI9YT_002244, partial [Halobacteriales archaeon]